MGKNLNQRCASLSEFVPGVVAVWKRSAFGGSMRHVELVDFHRKGIAMTKQSGDPSQEKSGGWEEYPVKRGIDGYSAYLQ
jgi:hypothetical protein